MDDKPITSQQMRASLVQQCRALKAKKYSNARIAEKLYLNERDVVELLADKSS